MAGWPSEGLWLADLLLCWSGSNGCQSPTDREDAVAHCPFVLQKYLCCVRDIPLFKLKRTQLLIMNALNENVSSWFIQSPSTKLNNWTVQSNRGKSIEAGGKQSKNRVKQSIVSEIIIIRVHRPSESYPPPPPRLPQSSHLRHRAVTVQYSAHTPTHTPTVTPPPTLKRSNYLL